MFKDPYRDGHPQNRMHALVVLKQVITLYLTATPVDVYREHAAAIKQFELNLKTLIHGMASEWLGASFENPFYEGSFSRRIATLKNYLEVMIVFRKHAPDDVTRKNAKLLRQFSLNETRFISSVLYSATEDINPDWSDVMEAASCDGESE